MEASVATGEEASEDAAVTGAEEVALAEEEVAALVAAAAGAGAPGRCGLRSQRSVTPLVAMCCCIWPCLSRVPRLTACIVCVTQDAGPPEEVVEAGTFVHPCEGEAVCKLTNEKVPCPVLAGVDR